MDYKKRINKLKNPKNILDVFLSVGKKSKSYKGRIRDIKETSENKNILKVYLKKLEKPARDIKELSEELERIQKANKKAVKEIDKKTSSFSKKGHEHKNFLTKKEHKQGQKIFAEEALRIIRNIKRELKKVDEISNDLVGLTEEKELLEKRIEKQEKKKIQTKTKTIIKQFIKGVLDMKRYRIINLADPVNLKDATTKEYVDDLTQATRGGGGGAAGAVGDSNVEDGTATGQMVFWDGSSEYKHTETSELVWDDVNKRMGVGVAAPSVELDVAGQVFVDHDTSGTVIESLIEVEGKLASTTEDTTMNFFLADMDNGSSYPSAGTQIKRGFVVENTMRGNQTGGTFEHLGGYFYMGSLAELPASALAVDHTIIGHELKRSFINVGSGAGGSWNDVTAVGLKLTGWEHISDLYDGIAGTFARYAIYSDGGNVELTDGDLITTGTITGVNVTSGVDPGHTHSLLAFIDQDVTSGSSPTFDGANFTGIPDGAMSTDYVEVAGDTMTGALFIDGSADVIQLKVQAHSTQNVNILEVEDSGGANLATVDSGGNVYGQGFQVPDGGYVGYSGGAEWLFDNTNNDISTISDVGIGTATPNQKLTIEGTASLKEQASANADTVAYGQIWVKSATPNELWFTDDAGTDVQLGAGGAGGGVFEEVAAVVRQASPGYDEDFVFGSPQLADDATATHMARFFFDKSKSAFRAGKAESDEWDDANVGEYSFAGGYNNKASALKSAVLGGDANIASGTYAAILTGDANIASGSKSGVLTGRLNQATDNYAGVLSGNNNQSKNWYSGIVTGDSNTVNGPGSTNGRYSGILAGASNSVSANYSAVITGFGCSVGGAGSAVIGGNTNAVNGGYSTCLGGRQNQVHGGYAVGGGRNMQMTSAAARSFAFGYHTAAVSITVPDAFLVFPSGTLGNMGLGTMTFGTSANAVFGIGNGVAPASSPANMVQLYAEDVSGSSELKVRDEAGNISTLSPHHFSLFKKPDPLAWSYYAKHPYLGKEINVDMWGMVKAVEELSGKKFIYTADIEKEDKTEQEKETVILEKMQEEVEISFVEAVEEFSVEETKKIGTKIIHQLNAETGELEEIERPKYEEKLTGKKEHRIKKGNRIDEDTGKCYRTKTREEAVIELK